MVKNPPSNAGDVGSIPGLGTKIPHVLCCALSLSHVDLFDTPWTV